MGIAASSRTAGAIAVALSLAVSWPVAAKDEGAVGEDVTVRQALSLVLDPTRISYGAVDAGATSREVSLTASVTAPAGRAWLLSVKGSRLESGDNTMAVGVRSVKVGDAGKWTAFSSPMVLARNSNGDGASVKTSWRVSIPADQAAGAYEGSLTFTVSAP